MARLSNGMRMTRLAAGTILAGVVIVVIVGSASDAGATLDGQCTASGTLQAGGFTVDPKAVEAGEVITVPAEDDVAWKGSVVAKDTPRAISGYVDVKLPFTKVRAGDWESPDSETVENSGSYHYDLPSLLAGIKVPVSGAHTEPGVECSGSVVVQIEGTSALAWVSLVLTVVSLAGVFLAVSVKQVVV